MGPSVEEGKKRTLTEEEGRARAARARRGIWDRGATAVDYPVSPKSVDELREVVQKQLLTILARPEVLRKIEKSLRSNDAKTVRDMLAVVLPHAVPAKAEVSRGPVKLTLINKIARSGVTQSIDVTPDPAGGRIQPPAKQIEHGS